MSVLDMCQSAGFDDRLRHTAVCGDDGLLSHGLMAQGKYEMKADFRQNSVRSLQAEAARADFIRNPIDVLACDHRRRLQSCDFLEQIADSLPDTVNSALCKKTISKLRYDLPIHHLDENQALFPLLRRRSRQGDNIDGVLDQLEAEHSADESYAAELTECLTLLARGEPPGDPNMIGYMLRGFFESYRRHLIWECELVLPLARKRLRAADLEELGQKMISHRDAQQVIWLTPFNVDDKKCQDDCRNRANRSDADHEMSSDLENVVKFPL